MPLAPVGLDTSAVPLRCTECRGTWLPKVAFDRLQRRDAYLTLADEHPDAARGADKKVGLCPFNHGLLIRAAVPLDERFFLERCDACGGMWFDAGEWAEVASRHFFGTLVDLWDPAHQRKEIRETARRHERSRLERELGVEDFGKLLRLVEALKDAPTPVRLRAAAFLSEELAE